MSTTKQWRVMDYLPRKIITPITGVLSLVIGISGVMLFFHFGEGLVKGVHEWLGIVFALIMLIHLTLNWNAFIKHFKKPIAWAGTGIVTAISAMFLVTAMSSTNGSPMKSIVQSIETSAVSDLAPVFKISQSEMVKRLNQAGVEVETGRETLQELAEKYKVAPRKLVVTLVRTDSLDTVDNSGR